MPYAQKADLTLGVAGLCLKLGQEWPALLPPPVSALSMCLSVCSRVSCLSVSPHPLLDGPHLPGSAAADA